MWGCRVLFYLFGLGQGNSAAVGRPQGHGGRGDAEQDHQRLLEQDHGTDSRAIGGKRKMRLILARPAGRGVMFLQLLPTAPGALVHLAEPCGNPPRIAVPRRLSTHP